MHFEADANCGFAIRIPASFCKPEAVVEVFASRADWRLPGCPLSLDDRSVWTLDALPRAIVGATSGLEQTDLDALKRAADGYALVMDRGDMATPTPTVFPDAVPYAVQAPAVYGRDGNRFLDTSAYPDLTIAKLANATCLPRGLIVTSSGGVVDECFQSLRERTFHHGLDVHGAVASLKTEVAAVRKSTASVLWIDHQHMNHYGHFITDVLSKLWAYPFLEDAAVRVLVSKTDQWWILKILELYGLPTDRIFILEEPTTFASVYVPTRAMQLYDYVSPHFFIPCAKIARDVTIQPDDGLRHHTKWFVSRRRQGRRRLVNEQEVERLFEAHGYRLAFPEDLPIQDQIALFKNATAVAGCSGSAMYSVIYGRSIESLIVLASPDLVIKSEQLLYAANSGSMSLIIGETERSHRDYKPGDVHNPWRVDPAHIEACLSNEFRRLID